MEIDNSVYNEFEYEIRQFRERNKNKEIEKIISDYKEIEGIECLTEEEFTSIFGESTLYPNLYLPMWGQEIYDCISMTDYEAYLLRQDINIVEPEPVFEWQKKEVELYIADQLFTEYGYDMSNADELPLGEWEKSLSEEMEYYRTLRKETVEIIVADLGELEKVLIRDVNQTISLQIIHLIFEGKQFEIHAKAEEPFIFYWVFDVTNDYVIEIGFDYSPDYVFKIINYYLETGLPLKTV